MISAGLGGAEGHQGGDGLPAGRRRLTSLAVRIYKTYQDAAISVVKNEPYRLAGDVWGIGFKTADKIAQSLGIPHDSPERVKAGLQYTLSEASDDGPLLPARADADRQGRADPGGGRGAGRASAWSELAQRGGAA